MKKKIVFILLFAFFSCSNDQDYLICNSSNSEHCKYFEIEYPNSIKEFQKLGSKFSKTFYSNQSKVLIRTKREKCF